MPTRVILEAIARDLCIRAVYNKSVATLAPHIVYTRHGELFVDALTVERDGKKPREEKLGSYKLAGLSEVEVVERPLTRFRDFNPRDPRYEGVTIFALES
ncbi:MAG: hypothetical protein JWM75_2849 [Sphingomonas bacterium]|nr:hypothetical protein [Sphingomonas bacterium]